MTTLTAAAECPHLPDDETGPAFIGMLNLYRRSGGLARAQEVFDRFKSRNGLDATTLARWVARRQVLCLQWNGEVWLPLFQFEYQYMTVKPTLEPVFATLNPVFSPWKLANWCAQPHQELDGESPANALSTSAAQVLRAACADSLALH